LKIPPEQEAQKKWNPSNSGKEKKKIPEPRIGEKKKRFPPPLQKS